MSSQPLLDWVPYVRGEMIRGASLRSGENCGNRSAQ